MRRPGRIPLDVRGLTGHSGVFRVCGGVERDPAVDAWLRAEPRDLRAVAQAWFERLRRCGPDVRELIHDGCPVACVGDVPFGYVNTFAKHASVGFFNGAALPDPAGVLQGGGKRMRHVKLRPGEPVDAAALGALIDAAYRDVAQRLGEHAARDPGLRRDDGKKIG